MRNVSTCHNRQPRIGSFEFSHPPDNSERMNVGAEYSFHKYAFLRGGYNLNYDAEGIAGGAGFHFPVSVAGMADLDYGYTDMKDLGIKDLTLDQLVRLRDHGITPGFVNHVRARGFKDTTAEELVRLKNGGLWK